ncbi:hypothetical protein OAN24_06285 [Pseudodesulfovibrio sp.]|nr:hypothetical protein [Pseudodesulfovibrio sp.]
MVNTTPVGVTMKGSAQVALRKATIINMAVLFFLAFLPGCAVVGPLLSIGGMAGLAPLQYASTAYTLGEFSYEFAVNDNDPSEVIEAKIDSVLTGEAFMLPDFVPGAEMLNDPEAYMVARAEPQPAAQTVAPALSVEARQKRVDQILGKRTAQFERLEHRRMAFLKAQNTGDLTLKQTAMASSPDLFQGAIGETTLR